MSDRIKVQVQRQRVNGTTQEKEVSIEILEDGINIPATGTITFESALVLARHIRLIAERSIVDA